MTYWTVQSYIHGYSIVISSLAIGIIIITLKQHMLLVQRISAMDTLFLEPTLALFIAGRRIYGKLNHWYYHIVDLEIFV